MIATFFLAIAMTAQSSASPPPHATPPTTQGKKADKKAAKNPPPDADLIGFLGDYEDAADGLDPIGLSEQMNDTHAAADAKKKDGHGP